MKVHELKDRLRNADDPYYNADAPSVLIVEDEEEGW